MTVEDTRRFNSLERTIRDLKRDLEQLTSVALNRIGSHTHSGGGGGGVQSVTAADGTITIGGTATDPTVAVDEIAQSQVTGLTSDLAGKQPLDSDLTAIAALSPSNDDVIQRKGGVWVARSMAQVKTDLALTKSDVGLGNVTNDAQITKALLDAKGDLIVATANDTPARLAVGSDGQVLTADSAQSAGVKWASPTTQHAWTTTAQTVTNSATLVNATELVLPMEANSTYLLEAWIRYISLSANADLKLGWVVPSGTSGNWSIWGWPTTIADGTASAALDTRSATITTSRSVATNDNNPTCRPVGLVTTGGTAGDLQLQFAQNTATASFGTSLQAGCWLRLTKLA